MPNTEYITIEGDRWDTIAFKAYGDVSLYPAIQSANPFISLLDVFDGGIRIQVPIIEDNQSTNEGLLPPWKRTKNINQSNLNTVLNFSQSNQSGSFDNSFDDSFG